MSRIANQPIECPNGVEVSISGQKVTVKGVKGQLALNVYKNVNVKKEDNLLKVNTTDKNLIAITGTTRSLINNMIVGVAHGFEKKLTIIGVGYRAKVSGKSLDLSLGFSHPVVYTAPEGIEFETPSNTEIIIKGIDKQLVGQVAAEIRAFRPPEPYKGKGVRYTDEIVLRKEVKKK